ncbi:MAG: hypothetical protein HWE24_17900 [Oceanospirillaceae bacterium]|nr:hypothetical protein [Oceanospirillaceae bacterium]
MTIFRDKYERLLLILSLFSLFALVFSAVRFPLIPFLENSLVGELLTSDRYVSIFENLLIGILSAYFFYILNNLLPRQKQKKDNLRILNLCLASVLDSYKRVRVYGHETALPYVNTECLNINWLKIQISDLKRHDKNGLELKFALDTAYTRKNDFENLLQIASNISPDHAAKWLELIDKVRLLSENYGLQPNINVEQKKLINIRNTNNPLHSHYKNLEFRIMELMEVTVEWLEMCSLGSNEK